MGINHRVRRITRRPLLAGLVHFFVFKKKRQESIFYNYKNVRDLNTNDLKIQTHTFFFYCLLKKKKKHKNDYLRDNCYERNYR